MREKRQAVLSPVLSTQSSGSERGARIYQGIINHREKDTCQDQSDRYQDQSDK